MFVVPSSLKVHEKTHEKETSCLNLHVNETIQLINNISVADTKDCHSTATQTGDVDYDDLNKCTNLLQYQNAKQEKHSKKLSSIIQEQKEKVNELQNRIGHYSVRNINKRDETAKKNLHLLRNTQRQILKQDRQLKQTAEKLRKVKEELVNLCTERNNLSDTVTALTNEVELLQHNINSEKSRSCLPKSTIHTFVMKLRY